MEFDPGKVATTREQFPALKDRVLGLEPAAQALTERSQSSRSFSARWITHTATAISSAGSASSRTTSTP